MKTRPDDMTRVDDRARTGDDKVDAVGPAPTAIGRYTVLEELGRGGMGVVYRAHDPKLDRAVAIKLVRSGRSTTSDARDRLAREARTLAQLSHPNVVEVFEIGMHDGQLFIAMELVVGNDLRHWVTASDRTVEQRVAMMVQAGRGLAAAHSAGLVHRDFKPDNVLVATDGRARVLDFGLARAPASASSAGVPAGDLQVADDRLTQTGLAMGTPAYMAPEQFLARGDDARMDQFAFCVTLFELLAGKRPYTGATFEALATATATEAIDEERAAQIDARLSRILRRGLRANVDARYPDMETLLAALTAATQRGTGRRYVALGALALGLGGAVAAMSTGDDAETCPDAAANAQRVWGGARRSELQAAIEATSLQYAPAVWAEVDRRAQAYAQQWGTARTNTCHAARSDAANVGATVDCLERQRRFAEQSLDMLAAVQGPSIHNAPRIVSGFPTADQCDDGTTTPAPIGEAVHNDLQQALTRARTSLGLGLYAAGLDTTDALLGRLPTDTSPGFVASVHLVRGRLLLGAGKMLQAADAFERAYFAASDAAQFDLALRGATRIAETSAVGYERRWTWARHAAAALARHGTDAELSARYDASMCALERDSGAVDDAIRLCEAALQHHEGTNPEAEIDALRKLASVAVADDDPARAYALRQRAVTLAETTWGQGHPVVADAFGDLGTAALGVGQPDEAEALGRRSLSIRQQTLGPDHPDVALSLDLLASVAHAQGDFQRARKLAEQGLALRTAAFGGTHPLIARSLYARALAEEKLKRFDDALKTMDRVAAIDEALHPLNIDRIPTLREQARMAFEFGDGPLRGRTHLERAWEIVKESKIPRDHPLVRDLNHGYGETLLELGEAEAALPYLEAFVRDPRPVRNLPHVKFVLARCLAANGREPERARQIVQEALAQWRDSTVAFEVSQVEAMRAWLAEPG